MNEEKNDKIESLSAYKTIKNRTYICKERKKKTVSKYAACLIEVGTKITSTKPATADPTMTAELTSDVEGTELGMEGTQVGLADIAQELEAHVEKFEIQLEVQVGNGHIAVILHSK